MQPFLNGSEMRFEIFFVLACICTKTYSQSYQSNVTTNIRKVVSHYLNYDPFSTQITSITDALLTNDEIEVDTVINSSDTSFYYLRGYHKTFNPFGIPLDSVRTIIAEVEQRENRTGRVTDTLMYLQTEGIAVGREQIANLRSSFNKMRKALEPWFFYNRYEPVKEKNQWKAESVNYWVKGNPFSLVNITWKMRNENVATITISAKLPYTRATTSF